MVKKWLICFLCFSMPLLGYGPFLIDNHELEEGVSVKVEVQDELAIEGKTFVSKLIIHHPDHEKVDEMSVKMDGKPLSVQLYTQGKQTAVTLINGQKKEIHQTISCYLFEMDSQKKGAYTLPSVEVKVGGKTYTTEPVHYLVNGTERSHHFNLESFIDSPNPLFPGQVVTVTYRITMSEPIEIFYDNLPLLDLKDFQKEGKRKSRVFYQGNQRVEEYTQAYKVEKAGDFEIEPSFLEGRAFSEDFFGRRRYKKEMLRAEAPKEEIKVQEFPVEGKPSSFNGAIGDFSITAKLDSTNQVCVGDKLKLKVSFKGEGLSSVKLPNLSLQKEFKENFRLGNMPALSQKEGGEKTFVCELRPMKEKLTEIPSFTFSYFDPKEGTYKELKTSSIPITLLPMKQTSDSLQNLAPTIAKETVQDPITESLNSPEINSQTPDLIDIHSVYTINESKKSAAKSQSYLVYWALAFAAIILLQIVFRYFFFSKKGRKSSAYYFQRALKHKDPIQNYQLLMEKALLLRLKEQNFIKEGVTLDQLGGGGIVGEVKQFIEELSMLLFSGQKEFDLKESHLKAKSLYKKIGENF